MKIIVSLPVINAAIFLGVTMQGSGGGRGTGKCSPVSRWVDLHLRKWVATTKVVHGRLSSVGLYTATAVQRGMVRRGGGVI